MVVSQIVIGVDPCGAELTGSRTVTASPGGTWTSLENLPMLSCEGRSGLLSGLATTRTRMVFRLRPFWIATGTEPWEPPIGTVGEVMIRTFLTAFVMY